MDPKLKKVFIKTSIFILSLSLAWWLVKSGSLESLVKTVLPVRFVSEIAAGVLYTSFFTSPISVAMLVVLAQTNNPIITALLAGLGAILGDLIMVKLFRDRLSSDFQFVSREIQLVSNFLKIFHLDFLIPLIGAFIVASPLPDELGLLMLGASKLRYFHLAILTYILNTAGILLIVAPINLLS